MQNTKIEWCDATWNPVTGCLHECPYCYARNIAHRFAMKGAKVGENVVGFVLDEKYKGEGGKTEPFPFGFTPTFLRYRLDEPQHKKGPRNVFVCSMADLFGEWVLDEWITQVFDACKKAPAMHYIFLTKNPNRYGELAGRELLPKEPSFWYGISAENHQRAEASFRHLPAGWKGYNFFLSAEPMHGAINLPALEEWPKWVIIGAETGPKAKQHQPRYDDVADLVAAASARHIPVFMKDSLKEVWGDQMIQEFPNGLRIF